MQHTSPYVMHKSYSFNTEKVKQALRSLRLNESGFANAILVLQPTLHRVLNNKTKNATTQRFVVQELVRMLRRKSAWRGVTEDDFLIPDEIPVTLPSPSLEQPSI